MQLGSPEWLAHDDFARLINAVNLKHILCQIQSYYANLVHEYRPLYISVPFGDGRNPSPSGEGKDGEMGALATMSLHFDFQIQCHILD